MALKALANEKCLQITTWNGGESDRKSNRSKIRLRTTLWLLKGQEQHLFFKIKVLTGNTQSIKHQLKTFMRSYANMVHHGTPFTGKLVKRKSKQSHFAKNGTLRESFKHCFAEINLANFFAELGGNPPPLPSTQSQPL